MNSLFNKLQSSHYWLKNAHIPVGLIADIHNNFSSARLDGLCLVNLEIKDNLIRQIQPATCEIEHFPIIDLDKRIVLPCFIDLHTHLDKGHIWERSPNLDGTFSTALNTAIADSQAYWQPEDLYPRLEFGLKCSYAHGTKAIRTHLDAFGEQADISFGVFQALQQKWRDKLELQAVSLVSLDYYQTEAGVALADKIKDINGILGGVAYSNPNLISQLERVFQLAKERNLDLDLHADETGEATSNCLQKIAETAIKHDFSGQITCGHCCSLAVQPREQVQKTIELVKQAKISIVSLPMCNLFLQDRRPQQTPFWRGVTRVKELQRVSIPVAFASDNCRDPFYAFGDHDVLEVFNQAVRICHLDPNYDEWIHSVTTIPAKIMQLEDENKITVDSPADLIIFPGRYFSELLARSQHERIVIRQGKPIDTSLPDYRELDDLLSSK